MKGLILKDLYVIRFQLIVGLIMALIPGGLVFLAGGGMFVSGEELKISGIMMFGMANLFVVIVLSTFFLNTLKGDIQSGWANYRRTMPVTSSQIIGGKLLATYLYLGLLTVISLAYNVAGIIVFGVPVEPMIAIPFCFALMQAITLSPTFPMAMRFGTKYVNAVYFTILTLMIIALVVVATLAFSREISETALRVICYGALPAVTVCVAAVSFIAGKRCCMREIEE